MKCDDGYGTGAKLSDSTTAFSVVAGKMLAQTCHLSPVELAELLVNNMGRTSFTSRRTGVQFGQMPHGFDLHVRRVDRHCLCWSSTSLVHSPPVYFPLVGDDLQCEATGSALRVVHSSGVVSIFSPKSNHQGMVGLMFLSRGTDAVYTCRLVKVHQCWSFTAQFVPVSAWCYTRDAEGLLKEFGKKLVMWLLSFFCAFPDKCITLRQLEVAFPLVTLLEMQERQNFVGGTLASFAANYLTFYDDHIIPKQRTPVFALSLLSPEQFREVTSVEQASVAFAFRCKMRHDPVLSAAQFITDTWIKNGNLPMSGLLRQAIAVVVAHALGTFALLPTLASKSSLRLSVCRNLPLLLESQSDRFASRFLALFRSSKTKFCNAKALLMELEKTVRDKHPVLSPVSTTDAHDEDVDFFLESPPPQAGADESSGILWRISKGTCGYTLVASLSACDLVDNNLCGTAADRLFTAAFSTWPRMQISSRLLKYTREEIGLQLNLRPASSMTDEVDDGAMWERARKTRRMRREP
ncbi:hypothetical protein ERJ75_000716000 [Trypanosoma vivax]|uniref:Uncharacterized protein n=1 Tax=Trypanosoma vivax (strain Y486) TaxID=1055687 RepID=G0TTR0_TRYVY|nr:hypothetical protein TRVL_00766 [Trypanosoma vivax]KAH8613710.1 hypothetical protein ERJ75_000716000 [Trypanosoma vivax]CCC47341.1 conserved hypothetical protein [Trypanosoma vivax Y486]